MKLQRFFLLLTLIFTLQGSKNLLLAQKITDVAEPQYDAIYENDYANNGLMRVIKDNKWGLIDISGKEVLPCKYDDCIFLCKTIVLKEENVYKIFNKNNRKVVFSQPYDAIIYVSPIYVAVKRNNKWGFINQFGKEIIPFKYDGVELSSSFRPRYGHFSVQYFFKLRINNKYGALYTMTCKEVVPCEYDHVFSDEDGYIVQVGQYKQGLEAQSQRDSLFFEKLKLGIDYSEEKNENWGAFSYNGNELLACEYTYNFCYEYITNNNLKDTKRYFYKYIGNNIIAKQKKDELWSVFNIETEQLDTCKYQEIDDNFWAVNLIKVKKNDKWGIFNQNQQEILPFQYDNITSWVESGIDVGFLVEEDNKYGLMDMQGAELVPVTMYGMEKFGNLIFYKYEKNGKWGIKKLNKKIAPQPRWFL